MELTENGEEGMEHNSGQDDLLCGKQVYGKASIRKTQLYPVASDWVSKESSAGRELKVHLGHGRKNGFNFKRSANYVLSTNGCLPLHSSLPFHPTHESFQGMKLKHLSSMPDISSSSSWQTFLPMCKPIQGLPAATKAHPGLPSGNDVMCAHLQCIKRGGRLSYTFTVEDSEDFLIARAMRRTNSFKGKEGNIRKYTFHFGNSKEKASKQNKGEKAEVLVGKMKVCSFLCRYTATNGTVKSSVEFQFVLLDGKANDTTISKPKPKLDSNTKPELASLPSTLTFNAKFLSMIQEKQLLNGLVQTTEENDEDNVRRKKPDQPIQETKHLKIPSQLMQSKKSKLVSRPSIELAALVIRVPCQEQEQEQEQEHKKEQELKSSNGTSSNQSSGWGLKFLGKKSDNAERVGRMMNEDFLGNNLNGFSNPSVLNGKLRKSASSMDGSKDVDDVIVIFPLGDHGLPSDPSSGPSPLIQRWRSGGKCDCGGWDLGCGLTILGTRKHFSMEDVKSSETKNSSLLPADKPLEIYCKNNKQTVRTLSLDFVQKGLYSLRFLDQLSPLQAFAMAVAILHSRDPKLSLKKTKQQTSEFNQIF